MSSTDSELKADDRGRLSLLSARDIVLVVGENGAILEANDSAVDAYGYSHAELLSMTIFQLRTESAPVDVTRQMEAAREGTRFRTSHRRRDGSIFPVEVNSTGIQLGKEQALVSIIRDVSEYLRRESELQQALAQSEEANRLLQGMTRLLSHAVGTNDVDVLLESTVEVLSEIMSADVSLFLVAESDGSFRVCAQQGAGKTLPAGFHIAPGEGFVGRVANAGQPLYGILDPDDVFTLPSHIELGIRSMFGVPVFVEDELFGVLECAWRTPRVIVDSERTMLRMSAARIALAISRSRLLERSRVAEKLSRAINEASAMLNAQLGVAHAIVPTLQIAADALCCDVGVYGMIGDDVWNVEHYIGLADIPRHIAMGDHSGLSWSDVQPTLLSVDTPGHAKALEAVGLEIAIAVPFRGRRDHFGVILLGRTCRGDDFDDAAIEFAKRLGDTVSVALSNALHFETEHRIAEALQEALLTLPAGVRGISFAHRYQSATLATRVGGDFLDVFELEDGRAAVLIGDVSGKGLEAAVLTSIIKDTIRAYAHEALTPCQVIAKANVVLERAATLPDFASVFFGVIDPARGELAYCSAGHPPAALVDTDGNVRLLDCKSPVIGAFSNLTFTDSVTTIRPDERLVLYTDGVTEARDPQGAFFAEQGLVATLSLAGDISVSDLPEALFEAVLAHSDGRLADDIALLAVQLA